MQFKLTKEPLEKIKTDIVVVLCQCKTKGKNDKGLAVLQKSDGGVDLDKNLGGLLSDIIKREIFRGDAASTRLVYTYGKIPARAVLMVGVGKISDFNLDVMRKVGAKIGSIANEIKAASLAGVIQQEGIKGFKPADRVGALVEGFILGSYKFEQYKDKKEIEPDALKEIYFITNGQAREIEPSIHKSEIISDAVNFARELVNLPARDLTPSDLAKKAEEVGRQAKVSCKVMGPKEIKAEKMELFLAVAKGAANEPRFIEMHYKPAGRSKLKLALIGKGITFDSGGYDLKVGRGSMLNMKCDMAGAAACIALMKIVGELKPNVEISVYIPATDNMIDAKAEVCGDIIKSRSGKTVEIISTDAEGRLILADAISYALDKKSDYIIDVATLTGGVLYAVGELYTAILGNDQRLVDKIIAAARIENEPIWQLPLAKEYKKGLTEGPADLKNLGKTRADTIAGGLFLEEFVADTKWAHLDIAESAWTEDGNDYTPRGGTGAMVRTLARVIGSF